MTHILGVSMSASVCDCGGLTSRDHDESCWCVGSEWEKEQGTSSKFVETLVIPYSAWTKEHYKQIDVKSTNMSSLSPANNAEVLPKLKKKSQMSHFSMSVADKEFKCPIISITLQKNLQTVSYFTILMFLYCWVHVRLMEHWHTDWPAKSSTPMLWSNWSKLWKCQVYKILKCIEYWSIWYTEVFSMCSIWISKCLVYFLVNTMS